MAPSSTPDFNFLLKPGVRIIATMDAKSWILGRFMEGYDRAFVLPDEKEELQGFEKCLDLNTKGGTQYCEMVAVLEDLEGNLLGGANFLATRIDLPHTPPAFIALNYVYVEPSARGRGLLRDILLGVKALARLHMGLNDPQPPVIFIEQNDPLRLSPEEYLADTQHSGRDQIDRLQIWSRVGAQVVDFAFVQPALSDSLASNPNLVYAALDYPDTSIPARAFKDHLESFFRVSVFKGDPISTDAQQQLDSIGSAPIGLLDSQAAIEWLRTHKPTEGLNGFRALVRLALT